LRKVKFSLAGTGEKRHPDNYIKAD